MISKVVFLGKIVVKQVRAHLFASSKIVPCIVNDKKFLFDPWIGS